VIGLWCGSTGLSGFTWFVFGLGFPLDVSTEAAGLSPFLALWTPSPVVAAMLGIYRVVSIKLGIRERFHGLERLGAELSVTCQILTDVTARFCILIIIDIRISGIGGTYINT